MTQAIGSGTGKKNRFLKIAVVLPVLMVGVTLASSVAIGIGGYISARSGLEAAANSELKMVAHGRKELLDMRLTELADDLSTMANSAAMEKTLKELSGALSNLDKERAELQAYFQPDGASIEERASLTGKDSKTMYAWRHIDVHAGFHTSWKNSGYADIYVLDPKGMVVYSVTKGDDFLSSVAEGPLQNSGLGEVFAKAIKAQKGERFYSSFSFYDPAGREPSLFVAEPAFIRNYDVELLGGVVAYRISSDYIEAVINNRDGLGESGQVYLADESGMLLTNQPLASERTALTANVSEAVLKKAFTGKNNQGIIQGKDGVSRLTVADAMTFGPNNWAVIAERSVDEAMASVVDMRNSILLATLLTLACAAIIALFFSRSITRPVADLVKALKAIAEGDTSAEIKAAKRGDEIGDIGRAVLQIRQNAAEDQERRAQEDAKVAQTQAEQRQHMLSNLAAEFEASVGKVVDHVAESASTLTASAAEMRQMMEASGETSQRAAELSSEAMTEVQSIATASDQLSSSIQEISSLIERSSSVAQTATVRAEATNGTVKSLAEAANRIGEVVTLISDIADQTNLLALNATIEAARAGEAGKGFAVVASEVKELASQTGKATGEIQQQIDAIRHATDDAVSAIGDIQSTINEITQSVTEVSAAVTEQSFATRGIAENTQRAAQGTSRVSEDISNVSSISEKTSASANAFAISVQKLSEQTGHLDKEVDNFLTQVRSA